MKTEIVKGAVTVLQNFVSADVVLPARYSFLSPSEMASHVLEELGPDVNARVRSHPVIVAGEAFGYGTGRESPARALRAAGVKAIIGGPFARMFFRNAINNGLLVLACKDIVDSGIIDGDVVEVELSTGIIRWKKLVFRVPSVPGIIQDIIAAGSLIDYGRAVINAAQASKR
jgi:3-isopropylmalate/(R)-2-methylmalate dehydratase small subunit